MKTQRYTLKEVLLFLSAFLIFIGLPYQANAAGSITLTGSVDCIVPVDDSTALLCGGEAPDTGVTTSSPVTLELSWNVATPTLLIFNPDIGIFGNEMTLTIGDVVITEQDIPDEADFPEATFTNGELISFNFTWLDSLLPGYTGDWVIAANGNSSTGDENIEFELQALAGSAQDFIKGHIDFGSITNPVAGSVPFDINGDSMSDIVIRHTSGNTWKYLMNGHTISSMAPIAAIDPVFDIVGVADITGDTKADIVIKSHSLEMIWYADGVTNVMTQLVGSLPTEWPVAAVADFNGDGTSDILIQNTTTGVLWLYNVENGAIVANGNFIGGLEAGWSVVGAGDINGDGMSDIVIRHTSGNTWKYLMNGHTISSMAPIAAIDPVFDIVGIADITGDTKADIVLKSHSLEMIWYADGVTNAMTQMVQGLPTEWPVAAVTDFTGDGTNDILLQNTTTGVLWLYNVESGAIVENGNFIGGLEADWSVQWPIEPLN
jgi:hypothetical protein